MQNTNNKLKQTLKSERGLTLMEIILVVVILGFLMAFLIPRIVSTGSAAKARLNDLRMQSVKAAINQFRLQYNSLPGSLDDLVRCTEKTGQGCVPVAQADDLKDVWGNPFSFSLSGDGRTFIIKTLGEDGKEGGEGVSYDKTLQGP